MIPQIIPFFTSLIICIVLDAAVTPHRSAAAEPALVRFPWQGQWVTGLSLARDSATWLILGTDGQLHYLEDQSIFREITPIEGSFEAADPAQLRASLMREYGPTFEVVPTKNFLVVQPRGRGMKWPNTFEELHRQFVHQLGRRGVRTRMGKFPMIAVVFADRAQLHAELARQKLPTASIAGIYVAASNRVYTHDGDAIQRTLSVLRHEAAHQSAFNSNIHSRLNNTPKWITEGLGMMFEPAAMTDSSSTLADRSHQEAIFRLRQRYQNQQYSLAEDIRRVIVDDNRFELASEAMDSYSVAWLMMFYLSERKPTAFAGMLNHTASRPPFVDYESSRRRADFERITGMSIDHFAAEAARFMETL